MNAMIIDSKDNVAVAIEPIAAGDTVTYLRDGKPVSLRRQRTSPFTTRSPPATFRRASLW